MSDNPPLFASCLPLSLFLSPHALSSFQGVFFIDSAPSQATESCAMADHGTLTKGSSELNGSEKGGRSSENDHSAYAESIGKCCIGVSYFTSSMAAKGLSPRCVGIPFSQMYSHGRKDGADGSGSVEGPFR